MTGVTPAKADPASESSPSTIHLFVAGAVMIAVVGGLISWLRPGGPGWSAALLRFYWFRLADMAVPMGVALGTIQLVARRDSPLEAILPDRSGKWIRPGLTALAVLASALYLVPRAGEITYLQPPRAFRVMRLGGHFPGRLREFAAWRDICRQIAESDAIPPDARFLTPRLNQTFKWYADRPEVVNWKEIPQDAQGIVEWWRRIRKIHSRRGFGGSRWWYNSLAQQGPTRLRALGRQYDAPYAVTFARPRLALPVVVENARFIVYRLDAKRGTGTLHLASESGNRHDIREPVPVFGQTLRAPH